MRETVRHLTHSAECHNRLAHARKPTTVVDTAHGVQLLLRTSAPVLEKLDLGPHVAWMVPFFRSLVDGVFPALTSLEIAQPYSNWVPAHPVWGGLGGECSHCGS